MGFPTTDSTGLKTKMPKAYKTVIALIAITCFSVSVLNNAISSTRQRRLAACRNKSGPMTESNISDNTSPDNHRKLSVSAGIGEFVARLLESDQDCDTAYPSGAVDSVSYDSTSEKAQQEPDFPIVPEVQEEVEVSGVTSPVTGDILIAPETIYDQFPDDTERGLITTYDPKDYDPDDALIRATDRDANTIGYVVTITGCPKWYQPSGTDIADEPDFGSDLYEASAVLKGCLCEVTEEAVGARRLGKTRKLRQLEDAGQLSAVEMNYTMHAIIHPMAVECPIQGNHGETYNRVKLLQSQNYMVEILGQPKLLMTHPYIRDNIPNDVGVRDATKLKIFTLILHPIVVLMDYAMIIQKPIDADLDRLLADGSLKGFYISSAPDPVSGEAGVDTEFLVVKPSVDEYNKIVNAYLDTPFDPVTGWNGQGHHNFKGGMGISGFLSYYFDGNPEYEKLDRCLYAHDAEEACLGTTSLEDAKMLKVQESTCGNPRDCPYDHPDWSEAKKNACSYLHRKYYTFRYNVEEKYFLKKNKTRRIGLFKQKSFLGYCRGPGREGSLSMTGDVIEKPAWQTVCPPIECDEGTFLKNDCTCTTPEDPCAACPANTFCQLSPVLMCIDCECGFCDGSGAECCSSSDGANTCNAGAGDNQSCDGGNDYFPAFSASGNVCGSAEFSKTAVPNGCGCKPTSHSPCTYNQDWAEKEEKCFICTADDLSTGQCDTCKDCLSACSNSNTDCMTTAVTTDDFVSCLSTISETECRSNCHFECMKN